MRHTKQRQELPDGTVVDLTPIDEDNVLVQVANKTGFARIRRYRDTGRCIVRLFNQNRADVANGTVALKVAVALICRTPIVLQSPDGYWLSPDEFAE